MPIINPVAKIPGKYATVSIVENYRTTDESEKVIEAATDIAVGGDEEVLESDDQLGVETTQRETIGGGPFIEIDTYLTPDNDALASAGITRPGGSWTTANRGLEAVRIRAYETSDLETVALVIDGVGVEPEWSDGVGIPTDGYGEMTVTFHCNERLTIYPDGPPEIYGYGGPYGEMSYGL